MKLFGLVIFGEKTVEECSHIWGEDSIIVGSCIAKAKYHCEACKLPLCSSHAYEDLFEESKIRYCFECLPLD